MPGGCGRLTGGAAWLAVTGTNGKTTTVRMLAAMLAAAGHRALAAGNVGISVIDAVTEPTHTTVLAVELSVVPTALGVDDHCGCRPWC